MYYRFEKELIGLGIIKRDLKYSPHFICIGAQKSGTTWLHNNLSLHSEIYLPEQKELHYFNHNYHTSLDYYEHFFKKGKGKVCGEITPAYSGLPLSRIKMIKRILPNLKIILILRNPIERSWSQTRMHFQRKYKLPISELKQEEVKSQMKSHHALSRGRYDWIISNWLKYYSTDQILLLDYEDISQRPEVLFKEVLEFLGLSTNFDKQAFKLTERIFEGKSEPIPDTYKKLLSELYQPTLQFISVYAPDKFQSWRQQ